MMSILKYGLPLLLVLHLITGTTSTPQIGGLLDGVLTQVVNGVVCIDDVAFQTLGPLLSALQTDLNKLRDKLQHLMTLSEDSLL